jgi:hypothetical protein
VHVTAFGEPVPQQPGSRHALRAALYRAVVALAAFVVVLVGLRVYLDSQWFVGVSNGRVAVFRGIPATVGGLDLNSVVVETTTRGGRKRPYRDLPDGITTGDRAARDRGSDPPGRGRGPGERSVSRAAARRARAPLASAIAFTVLALIGLLVIRARLATASTHRPDDRQAGEQASDRQD